MGSRPTAVDLSNAIRLLKATANIAALADDSDHDGSGGGSIRRKADAAGIRNAYILTAEKILEDDLTTNLAIGRYGAEYLRRQQMPITFSVDQSDEWRYFTTSPPGTQGAPDRTYRKLSVLTHCNTGYVIIDLYIFYKCFYIYSLLGLSQLQGTEQLWA